MNNSNLENEVVNGLEDLELKRLEIRAGVKSNSVKFILLPFLLIAYFLYKYLLFWGFIPLGIISIGVYIFFYLRGRKTFLNNYKGSFVKPLMVKLFPDLDYKPKEYISENIFNASGLFTSNFNRYKGDDYFRGKIGETPVEFSELEVTKETTQNGSSSNSSSSSNSTTTNIFTGILLKATISKVVDKIIIIDPILVKEGSPIPKFILNLMTKFLPDYGPVIKTGNEEFDSNFKLHCESDDTVKTIITSELIERITEIRNKLIELSKVAQSGKRYNQSLDKYMNQSGIIKFSLYQKNVFIALQNLKLFEINFGKKTTENIEKFSNSLKYIEMLMELIKEL